ncbi:MAG: flagellin [Nitrospirae bacterium]|uniref:flagellin N-terminal helical domain-containing protein n=1 Tax=Candidatus Magnetobacterium casense TaxID=1455061 RepID=UPI00058B800C|nr:flagellin [Candidatus Magnetobacterium casensis]MBF0336362.1 flagellin [Nitrospirota bacterium]
MAGFTINTNIMSINAQRNLRKTQSPLSETMQRLSSGLRINSAKDDAAGLAISTRMTTQIRGLTVATRNAADGLSMAQTAEGAMDEIVNNLQRIRELAVQAMSGQYGVTDVSFMQSEINALVEEIGRTAEQAKFNDRKLLSGVFTSRIHVSYAASDPSISFKLASLNTDAIGGATFTSTGKNGAMMYLYDIHTATTTGVVGVGDNAFRDSSGAAPTWSDTTNGPIVYTGAATLMVADPTSYTGFSSRASNTIAICDGAMNTVISEKAKMGAKSNQFEAIIRNIDNVLETTYAARSRILDADFAQETANMTKFMILQQAGMSVLAQANSIPQNVLQLLK